MATRLKTLEYWFPNQATIADASATALSQITIYIPESSITFKSVVCEVIVADKQTTSTNITQRQIGLTLQGAAISNINNTQTYTNSGENIIHQFSGDYTSYFNTNWAGTSRTLDCSLTINTSATGSANASVRMIITYTYDDTSTTHIKTVRIPLNSLPTAQLAAKGAAIDTIPALDTYCPEASKVYRQTAIILQGNQESVSTTDTTINFEVDALGPSTSNTYEKGLNSSSWFRYNNIVSFDTSTTHSFYIWANTTDFDHLQAYMVVTYEFDPSTTTRVLNSLMLPMEFGGGMGGPTASDYQRAERSLWIQEPGTITLEKCALLVFWDQANTMTGLNMRIGTGSFITYSNVTSSVCGGNGAMIRNDSAFTLSRGKNTFSADIYNTDALDIGYNLASVWIINYSSDKHTDGVGAHNHTVSWNLRTTGTVAAAVQSIISAVALDIPETTHFKNAVGLNYVYTTNTTGNASGVHIGVERLVAEGGLIWENVYEALGGTDPETGVRQAWASARDFFRRWVDGSVVDDDSTRMNLEVARRWRVILGGSAASFDHLDIYITYHSIGFTVSGATSNSNGGPITLHLHRADTGERVMETTVTGDTTYNFTWFDDTQEVYVDAYNEGVKLGRSTNGYAV